jgi:hypothetical protein
MLEWNATWFSGCQVPVVESVEDVGRFRVCVGWSFIVELVTCPFSDTSTSHFSTADLFPCLFLILVVQILSATHE